jgi:glucose-1-phosphate thymidylyltransferase
MTTNNPAIKRQVIGLIPAGGQGTRISPLPLSKELYPIGFRFLENNTKLRPKVVGHYLLEKMQSAGIDKAYFILRPGKWDIPAYFGDGTMLSMNLGYLIMNLPYGVPYTLDQAYAFVEDAVVALGFPDILFEPEDAFNRVLTRLDNNGADIVLGLFPCSQPEKAGMVDFDDSGKVLKIIEKVKGCTLSHMWGIAVWSPKFTKFIHELLINLKAQGNLSEESELRLSDVMQLAIDEGMQVEVEVLPGASYIDIGTPDDLVKAVREFAANC